LKEENNITKILENGDENVNKCIGLHHVPIFFLTDWVIGLAA
jgi:hypothetical protein